MIKRILIVSALFGALMLSESAKADETRWLAQCSHHRQTVESILKSEGVSGRFYYLMVAESHCTNGAKSEKGAVGYWQMMPSTMRAYGCTDPNDIICQTRAAAKYLKSLSKRFKTFDEVVAAWNMGGGNFKRIGKSRQARGLIYSVKRIEMADTEAEHVHSSRF